MCLRVANPERRADWNSLVVERLSHISYCDDTGKEGKTGFRPALLRT